MPQRKTKVAVLEFNALGISSAVAKKLENYFRTSINTLGTFQVIDPLEIQITLQDAKNKEVASCGGGPECAVKIGKLVQADVVTFGTISGIAQAYNLNLRLLNVKDGKELARDQSNISGNIDLLIPEVRLAAYRLVAPEKIRGALQLEIDIQGVDVELDGQKVGTTPLKRPIENLTPGQHVVVLKRPGFSEFQRELTIKPFETARLKIELAKVQEKK